MASGLDKIETNMDTHINNTFTARLLFLSHVILMLIVNKVDNRNPTMSVIHIVTKARSINDSELHFKHLFFQFCYRMSSYTEPTNLYLTCSSYLDLDSFRRCLCASLVQVFMLLDGCRKQRVYKCSLTDTRFTYMLSLTNIYFAYKIQIFYHKPWW